MKRPANPIAWIVAKLDSCRALLGVAGLLCLALPAFADICSVVIEKADLSPLDVGTLERKGYAVRQVDKVDDSLISLRLHTSPTQYAITQRRSLFRLHFELPAGEGNFPLLTYKYLGLDFVPSCAAMRKQIDYLTNARGKIKEAAKALKQKGLLLDSLVNLEEVFALSKGRTYPSVAVRAFIERVKAESREIWEANSKAEPWDRINEIRRNLIRTGLRSYCKGKPRFEDLVGLKCTNCVGQTQLILGVLDYLGAESTGVEFSFRLYQDHIAPVVKVGSRAFDALTFRRTKNLHLHDPRELVGAALRRWNGLIFPWDEIEDRWLNPPKNVAESLASLNSNLRPLGDLSHTEVFDFSAIYSLPRVSDQEPPEKADLSALLDVKTPKKEKAEEVKKAEAKPSLMDKALSTLGVRPKLPPKPLSGNGSDPYGQGKYPCTDHNLGVDFLQAGLISDNVHPADQDELFKRAGQNHDCMETHEFVLHYMEKDVRVLREILPLYRIALDEYPKVPGLGIVPEQKIFDQVVPTFKFSDRNEFESAKRMRYHERSKYIALKLSQMVKNILRSDLKLVEKVFSSSDPLQVFFSNEMAFSESGLRIAYLMQLHPMLANHNLFLGEVFPLDAVPETVGLQSAVREWGADLAANHRQRLAELNSYSEEEIARFLKFVNRLPMASLAGYIQPRGNAKMIADGLWPLEGFFTAILRDTEAWKNVGRNWKLQAVERSRPAMGKFRNLPKVDLPKLKVDVDCKAGVEGVQMGFLYAVCPYVPPIELDVPKMTELKNSLVVGLMIGNPQMFYHPGNLLMLTSLLKNETSAKLGKTMKDEDLGLFYGKFNPPVETTISVARLYAEKIIRAPVFELSKLEPRYSDSYGSTPVSSCPLDEASRLKAKIETAGAPAWAGTHPMYMTLMREA